MVLVERRTDPACWTRACGGVLSRDVLAGLPCAPTTRVAGEVAKARFVLPSGAVRELGLPLVVLDRPRWDAALIEAARAAGARTLVGARARSGPRGAELELAGRRIEVDAGVVIAADGARSGLVAQPRRSGWVTALQTTLRLRAPMDHAVFAFDRRWRGGYAWLFPLGELHVHVGVAVSPPATREARALLGEVVRREIAEGRVAPTEAWRVAGAPLPAWGPAPSAVWGRTLAVGDAAGHCDPVTLAGIHLAAAGGRLAGDHAARALGAGDDRILAAYDDAWRARFGRRLEDAAARRRRLEAEWDATTDLDALLIDTWPMLAAAS